MTTLRYAKYDSAGTQIDDPSVPFVNSFVTGLTASAVASAAANTSAINATLAQGGFVGIIVPGLYYVSSTLFVPSNTEFYIAKGVELILAPNSTGPLIANKNALVAGTAIGSAIIWFGGAPTFGVRIVKTGIGTQFPVGSFIGISGLTSSRNDQHYQGVWQVVNQPDANTIEFNTNGQPPNGSNSTAGGFYWQADNNIVISGSGTLNGNAANQAFNATVQFAGDPRSCLTWFRNVKDLIIRDLSTKRALSWGIASNNCVDYTINNIHANTYLTGATYTTDSIHLAGGHRRVLIENIFAQDSDNVIGLTIDKASTIVNSYAALYAPGDTHSIVIRSIFVGDTALATIIGIWGPTDYFHNSIVIDGVHGKAGGGVISLSQYTPTNMNGCSGGTLEIKNITVLANDDIIQLNGDGAWDLISIENVRNNTVNGNASAFVRATQITTAQTIKTLKISKLFSPLSNGTPKSVSAILLGNCNIDSLDISDIESIQFAVNVSLATLSGTGATAIKSINVSNCNAITASAGTTSILSVTGATPINSISFNNCILTNVAAAGFMAALGATAAVSAAFFNNCNLINAAGHLSATTIGRLNGANVQFDGAKITGTPLPGDIFYNTNAVFGAPGIGLYARGSVTFSRIAL